MNYKIHYFIHPRTHTPLMPKTPFHFLSSHSDSSFRGTITTLTSSARRSISQSNTLDKWIIVSIPSSSCLHLRSISSLKASSRVLEVDIHSSSKATKALSILRECRIRYQLSIQHSRLGQPRATVYSIISNLPTRGFYSMTQGLSRRSQSLEGYIYIYIYIFSFLRPELTPRVRFHHEFNLNPKRLSTIFMLHYQTENFKTVNFSAGCLNLQKQIEAGR